VKFKNQFVNPKPVEIKLSPEEEKNIDEFVNQPKRVSIFGAKQ